MNDYAAWIGRQRRQEATLDPWPVRALDATLDLPPGTSPDTTLPPLWHWLYFLDTAPRHRIGTDGHPLKGDFLPPVPQPRRMFAGAQTRFHAPLRLGEHAELTETVRDVQVKHGSQGEMVIVSVGFDYRQRGQLCIEEQRSYVYLPEATAPTPRSTVRDAVVPQAPWSLDLMADEVLLFRYSALTFNSHRIHYDVPYAAQAERYPALVVQAPLTATLLAQLARRQRDAFCSDFSFRATAPLFAGDTLRLRGMPRRDGDGAALTAWRPDGRAAMQATMRWR